MTTRWLAWGGVSMLVIGAVVVAGLYVRSRDEAGLRARMAMLVPVGNAKQQSCQALVARHLFIILALGQSNAGNHGPIEGRSAEPVTKGHCFSTRDPLPGATGEGGSIWSRLPVRLSNLSPDEGFGGRPMVLALLAVDSSSIGEWTREGGVLGNRLVAELELMKQAQLAPNLILWQQGEADAMAGRSTDHYAAGLDVLAELLTGSGVLAPVMVARHTVPQCAVASHPFGD
jgi:Carbohydrate esterase, sialic acid-specific acetylesterase